MNKEHLISSFAGAFFGVIFTTGLLHVCPCPRKRQSHDGELEHVNQIKVNPGDMAYPPIIGEHGILAHNFTTPTPIKPIHSIVN